MQLQYNLPGRLQVQSTSALGCVKLRSIWNWVSKRISNLSFHVSQGIEGGGQGGVENTGKKESKQPEDTISTSALIKNEKLRPMLLLLDYYLPSRIFQFSVYLDERWLIQQHLRPCVKYCQIKAQHPFTQQRDVPYKAWGLNPKAQFPIRSKEREKKKKSSFLTPGIINCR